MKRWRCRPKMPRDWRLRTQQVIAHESGVADTVDPLAGSYAIEELTTEIEGRVVDYLEKIDAMGGMLRAIESGYVQREIQEFGLRYQRAVETGDAIVVGVNRFQSEDDKPIKTMRIDPAIEQRSDRTSAGFACATRCAGHRKCVGETGRSRARNGKRSAANP